MLPIPISASELPSPIWRRIQTNFQALKTHRPLPRDALERLRVQLRLYHTYHSNAIEGNTLSLKETRLILEEGITIGGKSFREHLEATNNAQAFDWIWQQAKPGFRFDHLVLQQLHEMVTRGTLDSAGRYRTGSVWIAGAKHRPPPPAKIISLLDALLSGLPKLREPVIRSICLHHGLVFVHPFFDGNGRVARLAANLLLMSEGYPPIVLRVGDRLRYYDNLEEADSGNPRPFAAFVARAVDEALVVFLSAVESDRALLPLKDLARGSPYTQEYLSLRARQGALEAVKIDEVWYSSKRALADYRDTLGRSSERRST